MTINKEFDPLGDKLTCALYRTFIRFKIKSIKTPIVSGLPLGMHTVTITT